MTETLEEWKSNIEAMKKGKFLKEWEQLKFRLKTLEREKDSQVYAKRLEYRKYYSELEEVEVVLNEELKTERVKTDQHLGKIKNKVEAFQNQLKNVKPTPEFVEKLRQTMEDIESTITTFKQQQRKMFEELLTEEANVEHEIEIIQARIDTLSKAGSEAIPTKIHATAQLHTSALPREVKEFEKYLSQYGAQGGWDDYDHGSFLKIRNKCKGKPSFIRIAVNSIPGRTYDDIKEHEQWYQKFTELRNAKKNAILEWKIKKEQEQAPHLLGAEEDEQEKERLRKEKEKKEELEREQRKKELEEWKAKKAEQAKLELEEIERTEKRKKHLKEQEQARLNEIREAARERLREKKEEQERGRWREELEQEEIRAIRGEQALQEIARFQSRDQRSLQMKQRERERKEEKERIKKERIQRARATINVQPDRSRLYQPTDAWIQRKKQQQEKTNEPKQLSMPHRAVPSWRQGI